MTRAIPKEEREKIVHAYNSGLGTVAELAEIFAITTRSIYYFLEKDRSNIDLTPQKQTGRPPIITDEVLDILHDIVTKNSDGTLDDYRIELENRTGIVVSIATICNACNELDLRRKKKAFLQQNKNVKMSKKKEKIILK